MSLDLKSEVRNWVDAIIESGHLDSVKKSLVSTCGDLIEAEDGFFYVLAFYGALGANVTKKIFLESLQQSSLVFLEDISFGVIWGRYPDVLRRNFGTLEEMFFTGFFVRKCLRTSGQKLICPIQKSDNAFLPKSLERYTEVVHSLPTCDFRFSDLNGLQMIVMDGFDSLEIANQAIRKIGEQMTTFNLITLSNPKSSSIFLGEESKGPYTVIATTMVLKLG